MEIREYIRIFLKRGWIIALVALFMAASAIAFSRLQRPVYRATLYLNAIPARLDLSVQQTIKNMLNNYGQQIKSDLILAQVDEQLQLDMPPDLLRADIHVNPIQSDFLIQISVDNHDPLMAKDIADTTADIFVAHIAEYMKDQDKRDRVDVFVSDYARPGSLHKPRWKISALAGGVLGGLLGLLVLFFLEWVEADAIRSEEDLERRLGLPVLGRIPGKARRVHSQSLRSLSHMARQELAKARDQFAILFRYGWIIVTLAVITGASAIVFSKLQRPVYRATLYLNAIPARLEWGIQQTIQNQLRYYGRQITADQTLGRVDQLLKLDMPPDVLRTKVSVDPIESDLRIQIAVDSYDPMVAKNIADTAADVFVEDISVRMLDQDRRDQVDVFVSDYARPGSLFRPKWKINALAGTILGGLLGLVVVLVLGWLEADIILSREDISRHVGLPVMGVIPALGETDLERKRARSRRWLPRLAKGRLSLDSRS